MKKLLLIVLGLVGVMILVVSPVFGSQIMGTPLYRDPGVDARIRRAPLPEGYRPGRALPPSVDLEVEWRAIGGPDFNRFIRGIFIDSHGTIRAVDSLHPQFMRGMRVWKTDNIGKTWRVERQIRDAWANRSALMGQEKGKMLFGHRGGGRKFQDWPLEVETLLKTEFRGLYEQRAPGISGILIFLARDPRDERIMAFLVHRRLFVTVDGGEKWMEINSPVLQFPLRPGEFRQIPLRPGGLAVKGETNVLRVFIGARGGGPIMVQMATIDLSELEN